MENKEQNDKKTGFSLLYQFLKFGVVGVSNTLVFYAIYALVIKLSDLFRLFYGWDYIAGNVVGWVLSVLWSFVWNRKFVFIAEKNVDAWWKVLIKTYISYAFTGVVLNNILSYLWIDMIGVNKFMAPIINLVVTVPLNFILNKFWAFRR